MKVLVVIVVFMKVAAMEVLYCISHKAYNHTYKYLHSSFFMSEE